MTRLLTILQICFITSTSFAQNVDPLKKNEDEYNLGFEKVTIGTKDPVGWYAPSKIKSGYKVETDTVEKHSGNRSLLIEKVNLNNPAEYEMAGYFIPAKYEGKEIEIRAYIKLSKVSKYVNMILRIDDADDDRLQFANLMQTRIYGTKDWQQYSLKLPLPEEAKAIRYWVMLAGPGKLWIDDLQILIDGKDISLAKIKPGYKPNEPKPPYYGENASAGNRIKVKDAELYYETYGKGEPLLLLHGNSQSIHAFKKQIKEFSKTYRVIAVDTRGQGKSTDFSTEPLSYDLYAEDMKTLLDSLHIAKANILGWSDGGNTGLIMASKYPNYVNKLAVTGACTNPNDAVSAKTLEEVGKAIESLKSKSDVKSKYQVRLFTMLLTEPHITSSDLKNIKAPVLVMAGEKDMILEKHTKYIAGNIQKSKLFIFKGATHYAPIEVVSEFNSQVLEFLNKK